MKVSHIAFDVWGTIFKSNPAYKQIRAQHIREQWLPKIPAEDINEVFADCKQLFDTHEMASGESIPYDYKQITLVRELGLPLEVSASPHWKALFTHLFIANPPTLMHSTIPDLIKGWVAMDKTTSIISNTHFIRGMTMRKVLCNAGINIGTFEWCLFSDEHRWCKPHVQMFNMLTDLLGASHQITPEECLMVGNDDRLDIVPAAKEGWQTLKIAEAEDWLKVKAKIDEQSSSTQV